MTISRKEMNPKGYKLTPEQEWNQVRLHTAMNMVRAKYAKSMIVTSGVRDMAHHKKIYTDQGVEEKNIPMGSMHLQGLAIDIADSDGKLWKWCIDNLDFLQSLGLYLEDKRWTRTWVHFQLAAPRSGKRIFIPNSQPAPHPNIWDGNYDKKYDN
jgi:hypothetical protein